MAGGGVVMTVSAILLRQPDSRVSGNSKEARMWSVAGQHISGGGVLRQIRPPAQRRFPPPPWAQTSVQTGPRRASGYLHAWVQPSVIRLLHLHGAHQLPGRQSDLYSPSPDLPSWTARSALYFCT